MPHEIPKELGDLDEPTPSEYGLCLRISDIFDGRADGIQHPELQEQYEELDLLHALVWTEFRDTMFPTRQLTLEDILNGVETQSPNVSTPQTGTEFGKENLTQAIESLWTKAQSDDVYWTYARLAAFMFQRSPYYSDDTQEEYEAINNPATSPVANIIQSNLESIYGTENPQLLKQQVNKIFTRIMLGFVDIVEDRAQGANPEHMDEVTAIIDGDGIIY